MMNHWAGTGRIVNTPEMRYSPAGTPITKFRLAVDRGKKGDDGKSETDWLNIVCFQKTAELVAEWLDKGALVGIEGRVQSRTWEGQDGKKNYAVEIVANQVHFLESKAEADRRRAAGNGVPKNRAEAEATQGVPEAAPDETADDKPWE